MLEDDTVATFSTEESLDERPVTKTKKKTKKENKKCAKIDKSNFKTKNKSVIQEIKIPIEKTSKKKNVKKKK